jgi:hypothetical protein
MRKVVVLLLLLAVSVSAAPKKKRPVTFAPDAVPHETALFLGSLSNQGGRQITFKATAVGTRFFFEEPGRGVSVYRFVNGSYIKEEFLRDSTLDRAVKRYAKR